MITDPMLDFIRQQQQQKVKKDQIIHNLKASGWKEDDIKAAFKQVYQQKPLTQKIFTKITISLLLVITVLGFLYLYIDVS